MTKPIRVLVLTRYQRLGSSSRVRFYQYFPYLESQGLKIVNAPFFEDEYIQNLYAGRSISFSKILQSYLRRIVTVIRRYHVDLLWVEKEILPWFPAEVEELFKARRMPSVVDYDDAVFHRYELHSNALVRTFLGQKIDKVMQQASLVVAGNEYLAERASDAGAKCVEILPSVVDVSQYTVKPPATDNIFKIGWIGSPVTAQYLGIVREVIAELSKESRLRLVLVGLDNSSLFPTIPTELISWNENVECKVSQEFDVGIMPLADGPFERGKCGYKLIQYMAGGVPVVASPVGVNQQIVEHQRNGYLANSSNEWLIALRALRDNPQQRWIMGQAGRKKAETEYNLQVTAPKLLEMLKSVIHL
jgi:glycosyltransferase involved in cell wall biosynthesis